MKRVSALILMILLILAVSLFGNERKRATVMIWYLAPGNPETKTEELRSFAVESGGYVSYFSGTLVKLKVPAEKLGALKELLDQGAYLGTDMGIYGLNQSREILLVDLASGEIRSITPAWDRMPGNSVTGDCRHGGGPTMLAHNGSLYVVVTEGGNTALERVSQEIIT